MNEETHYDVLGLDHRTCGIVDIKSAYRTQARLHHPDRVAPESKEESTTIFRKLTEAYEVLSDAPKKLRYDSSMGLYRKRNNVSNEAGNYFNKNTNVKKVGVDKKRSSSFNKNKQNREKRPSDVDKAADKKRSNFLKNAFGGKKKTKKKENRHSDATMEAGNYFNKNTIGKKETFDDVDDRNHCPVPTCKIKKCSTSCDFSTCKTWFSADDLDCITIFTGVTVCCGVVFFVAVLIFLIVALNSSK